MNKKSTLKILLGSLLVFAASWTTTFAQNNQEEAKPIIPRCGMDLIMEKYFEKHAIAEGKPTQVSEEQEFLNDLEFALTSGASSSYANSFIASIRSFFSRLYNITFPDTETVYEFLYELFEGGFEDQ